jgi:hypothetical protein
MLAAPFVAIFAFPIYILIVSGELLPVPLIIKLQDLREPDSLVGLAYTYPVVPYKLNRTIEKHPKVLVLGTSRVMQFRSTSFVQPDMFYNAGGGVETLAEFKPFLEKIPASGQPQVLVVGIDQFFFNRAWLLDNPKPEPVSRADTRDVLGTIVGNWKRVYGDYIRKRYALSHVLFLPRGGEERIGLQAFVSHEGFRGDGSFDYGSTVNPNPAARVVDVFQRIDRGDQRFQRGRQVDPETIEQLAGLLAYCHSRGIRVIGFLPPYPHSVYAKMKDLAPAYDYMSEIMPSIQPLFDQYGYTLRDYSDLATLGVSDENIVDGLHGDQAAYALLLMKLADADPVLRSFTKAN